jgi:hypothetical protein
VTCCMSHEAPVCRMTKFWAEVKCWLLAVPLTQHAWRFRYPSEPAEPSHQEVDEAYAVACEVHQAILARKLEARMKLGPLCLATRAVSLFPASLDGLIQEDEREIPLWLLA